MRLDTHALCGLYGIALLNEIARQQFGVVASSDKHGDIVPLPSLFAEGLQLLVNGLQGLLNEVFCFGINELELEDTRVVFLCLLVNGIGVVNGHGHIG